MEHEKDDATSTTEEAPTTLGVTQGESTTEKAATEKPSALCPLEKLLSCKRDFEDAIGTELVGDAQKSINYLLNGAKMYGKEGHVEFLSAFEDFRDCLGDHAEQCVSVEHLKKIGLNYKDAAAQQILWRWFNYVATDGFDLMINNFDCILKAQVEFEDTKYKCIRNFTKAIKKDHNNACEYIKPNLQQCVMDAIPADSCPEARHAVCKVLKISIDVTLPECEVDCSDYTINEKIVNTVGQL